MHEQSVIDAVMIGLFVAAACLYGVAVVHSNRRLRAWPRIRVVLFMFGLLFAILSVVVGEHEDFVRHMMSHLLLGMLAPLLLAFSRPMTLMLRALPIRWSRQIMKLMKTKLLRLLMHPIFTGFMNIGGLWLLYTTRIFDMMYEHLWLYLFIHLHLLIAGYLFTVSIIGLESFGKQMSLSLRAIVLLLAMALHGMLAKILYATPPSSVELAKAELGAMVMYYGGDLVDAILIVFLCLEWYKVVRPSSIKREVVG